MKLSDVRILVVGPFVWGIGLTIKEALAKARKPKKWQAMVCHKDTKVDGMGRVSYPIEHVPFQIAEGGYKKGEGRIIEFTPPEEEKTDDTKS